MTNKKHKSVFTGKENTELCVCECGWEKCVRAYTSGPLSRAYYTAYYIVSGRGEYHTDSGSFNTSGGDIFLVPPDKRVTLKADPANPWVYFWVGFNGGAAESLLTAAGFAPEGGILKARNPAKTEKIMRNISQYGGRGESGLYGMLGYLYLLFAELIPEAETRPEKKQGESYVSIAMDYINNRYSQDIGIDGIAFHIGIERSYFYKVFKDVTGFSPQEYLINVRMTHARDMLRTTDKSLKEIAADCGYFNYSNFSKMFKKKFGISPKRYEKKAHGRDTGILAEAE